MIRTYSELQKLITFEERYNYLRLKGEVGKSTFGYDRYLNQTLYRSRRWRRVRDEVIIRDEACDLGIYDFIIVDKIIIHHMNPISKKDIELNSNDIFNPNYLICVSERTHLAIHYSDEALLQQKPIIRRPNDTVFW